MTKKIKKVWKQEKSCTFVSLLSKQDKVHIFIRQANEQIYTF